MGLPPFKKKGGTTSESIELCALLPTNTDLARAWLVMVYENFLVVRSTITTDFYRWLSAGHEAESESHLDLGNCCLGMGLSIVGRGGARIAGLGI
jgi:hypothetical protein